MDNYLVDRETLGQFVDELIKEKYPSKPAENFSNEREQIIVELDKKIEQSLYNDLSTDQLIELNKILDKKGDDPDALNEYLEKNGASIEQRISKAMISFASDYLGGKDD